MTEQTLSSLEAAKAHYDREGYAIFPQVIDPELVAEASRHVDWLLERNPGLRPEQLHHTLMADDPFWVRLVADERLLDVAEQFIGPHIALFASHYISKPPFDGQPVLWHQDGSYWPLRPMEVVTLWLAVDDSTPENGCMQVIPGTQHTALQKMQKRTDVANVLNSAIDPALVDLDKAVDIVLQAGDVSVHHPNIIHGSNANTSPRRRAGLTIRFRVPAADRARVGGIRTFLLRGAPVPGINNYRPRPQYVEGRHMPFRR